PRKLQIGSLIDISGITSSASVGSTRKPFVFKPLAHNSEQINIWDQNAAMMLIASDVYLNRSAIQNAKRGIRRVGDGELSRMNLDPALFYGDSTSVTSVAGFKSALYTDDLGTYFLAFAGTEDWLDISTDILQPVVGRLEPQYKKAIGV